MKTLKISKGMILLISIIMLAMLSAIVMLMIFHVNNNISATKNSVAALKSSGNAKIQSNLAASFTNSNNYANVFFVDTYDSTKSNYNIKCGYKKVLATGVVTCEKNIIPISNADFKKNLLTQLTTNSKNINNLNLTQIKYNVDQQEVKYILKIDSTVGSQNAIKNFSFTLRCPDIISDSGSNNLILHSIQPGSVTNLKMMPLSYEQTQKLGSGVNSSFPNLYCACTLNNMTVPTLEDGTCLICETGYYLKNNLGVYSCQSCPNSAEYCNDNEVKCKSDMQMDLNSIEPSCICKDPTKYLDLTNNTCINCPPHTICNGTTDFTCAAGFTKDTSGCSCDSNKYISGSGSTTVCNKCPEGATCNGTANFTCPTGFTKGATGCNCDSNKYITGSGSSAVCNNCPTGGICNGTNDFMCNSKFYKDKVNNYCIVCPANAICDGTENFSCYQGFNKELLTSGLLQGSTGCVCASNKYITGSGSTTVCNDCPAGATCNGTTNFTCLTGFTKGTSECSCDSNKYITGSGSTAICNDCPVGATCNGTTNFTCLTGFTKGTSGCSCDSNKYISGSGSTAVCNNCPTGGICNGTNNFMCNSKFYKDKASNYCIVCPANAICDGSENFSCYQGFNKEILTSGLLQGSTGCVCASNKYITGSGSTTVCNDCPKYATCNGTTNFTCLESFTKGTSSCNCNNFVINENYCMTYCPEYATCDGENFTCNPSFIKNLNLACICNSGQYIVGSGSSAVCNDCPKYATCPSAGATDFYCPSGFIKGANSCKCPSGYYNYNTTNCYPCPVLTYSTYPDTELCKLNTSKNCKELSKTSDSCEKCDENAGLRQDRFYLYPGDGKCYPCPRGRGISRCQCPDGINVSKDTIIHYQLRWLERRAPTDQDYWDNNCGD